MIPVRLSDCYDLTMAEASKICTAISEQEKAVPGTTLTSLAHTEVIPFGHFWTTQWPATILKTNTALLRQHNQHSIDHFENLHGNFIELPRQK